MQQQIYDLFGEIPVTQSELRAWVAAVAPHWLTPERSYLRYVETWNVVAKVRYAKLAGTFDDTVEHPVPAYHARFALSAIL